MTKTQILDCTLRDGGYINNWNFGDKNIKRVVRKLVNSKPKFLFSGFLYTIFVIIFSYIFPQLFATNRDEIKEQFYKVKEYVTKK